jgi:hypothetical protein
MARGVTGADDIRDARHFARFGIAWPDVARNRREQPKIPARTAETRARSICLWRADWPDGVADGASRKMYLAFMRPTGRSGLWTTS